MSKSKQNQVTTAVTHNTNTEVTVTTKVKRKWRGKMFILGLGEGGSFNIPKAMASLSKASSFLFWDYIIRNVDRKTNFVPIDPTVTGLAPNVLSPANTELIKAGLMLKVKNGLYMLNPRAIFVAEEYADAADEMWNTIKLKRMTKESR